MRVVAYLLLTAALIASGVAAGALIGMKAGTADLMAGPDAVVRNARLTHIFAMSRLLLMAFYVLVAAWAVRLLSRPVFSNGRWSTTGLWLVLAGAGILLVTTVAMAHWFYALAAVPRQCRMVPMPLDSQAGLCASWAEYLDWMWSIQRIGFAVAFVGEMAGVMLWGFAWFRRGRSADRPTIELP